ncbi:site-specific integrase [Microbacterium sp. p3-SID336]|nr:site-specific integrase [Microbacterium sp. p3-SID336]MCT1478350.1 site-specific integrase [Microbacterium sp. p3-SID336]
MFVPLTKVSTTEQLAALWLADIDLRPEDSLEQSSREAYHNRVKNNILPYIGAVPIGSLSAGFIHNLLQRLARERSYSFASVTRKTLSGMLTFAALNGVIDTSPMNDVPKLKNNAPRKKIQLDEDQLLLIIALIRDWEGKQGPGRFGGSKPNVRVMEDFLLITLGTSLRPGEVLGLSLDDVHLLSESAKVSVTGNVNRTKKHKNIRKDHPKGRGQQRTMSVPKYADTVLRRLVASYKPNPDQLLIATKKGTPMSVNYIDRLFREFRNQHRDLLTRIGIDVDLLTPYSLRKTVASVVNEGGGAELAAKVLGHTDSRITKKHYIHELKEVDPEAAQILDRAFSRLTDAGI